MKCLSVALPLWLQGVPCGPCKNICTVASWTSYVEISAYLHVEAGELVLDACGGEVDGEALLELAPLQHRDRLLPAAAALLRHEEHPLPLLLLRVQHVLQLKVCTETERH